jgi:hypothetical protein
VRSIFIKEVCEMHIPLNRFFYFSLFISVGVIAKLIRSAHRKKRIYRILNERSKLAAAEFGNRYFTGDTASIAAEITIVQG